MYGEQILREQLRLEVWGYRCTSAMAIDVLLKAAVDGLSVDNLGFTLFTPELRSG
jgi:hypothetical protein